MQLLTKLKTLTLQNQLRLMSGTSLLGMLAVIVFLMINVNQLRHEFKNYQSMQTMDKSLIEIKANALAISRADPILMESEAQLEQTDVQINELQKRISGLSSGTARQEQLAAISKNWSAYVNGFKGAIKIASNSPADALQIPDVMYTMYLAPMIKTLDELVTSNRANEIGAEKSISSVMSSILWVVLLPLILLGLVTAVTQTLFGRQLRSRLDGIVGEITHLHNGDLSHRLPECSNDEIGKMSATINNFIARFESILHGVHSSANQTHKTAHDVSQMAHTVTQNAKEQSSRVFQVSGALENMGSTIRTIAINASQASDAARQTSALIQSGNETSLSTIAALDKIDKTVGASATTLAELNCAIGQIGKVSRMIKDIAEQTNLLALNAAIEAARAGEQGRGFAVVADEVRKLAERTANATSDITRIVQIIENQTTEATGAMASARQEVGQGILHGEGMGQLMLKIEDSIRIVTEMMTQIAGATENQSSAGDLICQHIDSVAIISANTATDLEQARNEMMNLADDSRALYETVGQFKMAKAA